MSKIYEALQNVHREKKGGEESYRAAPVPFAPLESVGFGFEDEMLSLYKLIETLLPHHKSRIVQFIGAREGEGTSTISREFAKVAADLMAPSVLLVRRRPAQSQPGSLLRYARRHELGRCAKKWEKN